MASFLDYPRGDPDKVPRNEKDAIKSIQFLKDCGNEAFKKKNYEEARRFYKSCAEIVNQFQLEKNTRLPEQHRKLLAQLYSNLSTTMLTLKNEFAAEAYASDALTYQPNWHKGHWRLYKAISLTNPPSALKTLRNGLERCEMDNETRNDFVVEWLKVRRKMSKNDKELHDDNQLQFICGQVKNKDQLEELLNRLANAGLWLEMALLLWRFPLGTAQYMGAAKNFDLSKLSAFVGKQGDRCPLKNSFLVFKSLIGLSARAETFGAGLDEGEELLKHILTLAVYSDDITALPGMLTAFQNFPLHRTDEAGNLADFVIGLKGRNEARVLDILRSRGVLPSRNAAGPASTQTSKKSAKKQAEARARQTAFLETSLKTGDAYLDKRDYKSALDVYSKAIRDIEQGREGTMCLRKIGSFYSNRALCWLNTGETEKSLKDAETAMARTEGKLPEALSVHAQALLKDCQNNLACDQALKFVKEFRTMTGVEGTALPELGIAAKAVSRYCRQRGIGLADPRFLTICEQATSYGLLQSLVVNLFNKGHYDNVGDLLMAKAFDMWSKGDCQVPEPIAAEVELAEIFDADIFQPEYVEEGIRQCGRCDIGELYPDEIVLILLHFGADLKTLEDEGEPAIFRFVRLTLLSMPTDVEEPRDFDILQTFFDRVLGPLSSAGNDLFMAENHRGENIFDFIQASKTRYVVVKEELLDFLGLYGIRPKKKSKTEKPFIQWGTVLFKEANQTWAKMPKVRETGCDLFQRGPKDGRWFSKNDKPSTPVATKRDTKPQAKKTETKTQAKKTASDATEPQGKKTTEAKPQAKKPITETKPQAKKTTESPKPQPAQKTTSVRDKVKALKEEGNALHKASKWREAVDKYTMAIASADKTVPAKERAILYSNRAGSYMSLDRLDEAYDDAKKAVVLDKTYARAYFRCASILEKIGNPREAASFLVACFGVCTLSLEDQVRAIHEAMVNLRKCGSIGWSDAVAEVLTESPPSFLKALMEKLANQNLWVECHLTMEVAFAEGLDASHLVRDIDLNRCIEYSWRYTDPVMMIESLWKPHLIGAKAFTGNEPLIFTLILAMAADRCNDGIDIPQSFLEMSAVLRCGELNEYGENGADFVSRLDMRADRRATILDVLKKRGVVRRTVPRKVKEKEKAVMDEIGRHQNEAQRLTEAKEYDKALESYLKAFEGVNKLNQNPMPVKLMLQIALDAAKCADMGQRSPVLDFNESIKADPTHKELTKYFCRLLIRMGRYDRARDAMMRCLIYRGSRYDEDYVELANVFQYNGYVTNQPRETRQDAANDGVQNSDQVTAILYHVIEMKRISKPTLTKLINQLQLDGHWDGFKTLAVQLMTFSGPNLHYGGVAKDLRLSAVVQKTSYIGRQIIVVTMMRYGADSRSLHDDVKEIPFIITAVWCLPGSHDESPPTCSPVLGGLFNEVFQYLRRDKINPNVLVEGHSIIDLVEILMEKDCSVLKQDVVDVMRKNGVKKSGKAFKSDEERQAFLKRRLEALESAGKPAQTKPPPPPQQQNPRPQPTKKPVPMKSVPRSPCHICEQKYQDAVSLMSASARPTKKTFDVCESLCVILETKDHKAAEHETWMERSLLLLVRYIQKQEVMPKRITKLPQTVFERLVMAAYPTNWDVLFRLLELLKLSGADKKDWLKGIASKMDIRDFIRSEYLRQAPVQRGEKLRVLLNMGLADLETGNGDRPSPLKVSCGCRDFVSIQILILEFGADPRELQLSDIDTPLHAALSMAITKTGGPRLLDHLLQLYDKNPHEYAYLRPDVRDDNGDTLMHLVAKSKTGPRVLRMVEHLRGLNIDRDMRNKDGKRAQDYLGLEDKRYRFLQGSSSTTSAPPVIPVPPSRQLSTGSYKEIRKNELVSIVESFGNRIIQVGELQLSESEGEEDDSDLEDENDVVKTDDISTVVRNYEAEVDDHVVDTDEEIEINAEVFDNLEWEVECTADVWRKLLNKKLDRSLKMQIVKKIRTLASGEWYDSLSKELSGQDGLMEIKFNRGMRVLWEVAIAFSERRSDVGDVNNQGRRIYAEIIRVWNIVFNHDHLNRTIEKIASAKARGQESILRKDLQGLTVPDEPSQDNTKKRLPSLFMEKSGPDAPSTVWQPPASSKKNEYHIMKFYAVNSAMVKYFLEHDGLDVDFPFNVTELEYTYIKLEPTSPLFILGRSGTGKTTCCLYRLWSHYLAYWSKAMLTVDARNYQHEPEPLIPRVAEYELVESDEEDDDEADEQTEQDEPTSNVNYDHLRQVFVTKNRVLTKEVRRNFRRLCRTNELAREFQCLKKLPVSFQEIPSSAYPLFLTSRQLLLLLDGSLPKPFFQRNSDGDLKYDIDGWGAREYATEFIHEDTDDEAEDNDKQSRKEAPRKEVTYEVFAHKLWPKLKKELNKKNAQTFHPALVWMEIISFIKGSMKALRSEDGYLSLEEYKVLGKKQAPHFTADRDEVYKLFTAYQGHCRKGYFDECDVVRHVYIRLLSTSLHHEWVIHQISVDEVQDFTQAELCLLVHMTQNPNTAFFTGDTAQSIMRGVAFRFCDLKTLFHSICQTMKPIGKSTAVQVPKKVYELTQNYRSHAGIIRLANSVISLLTRFFPHSFDPAERDSALFEGPKPVLFDSLQFEDLALILAGNMRESSQIEFGAHQAVIVVNDEAREKIPEDLKHCLILTVYESKGLEFDDVLLFNFFKDSQARQEWRVISQYLIEMEETKKAATGETVELNIDALSSDSRAHPLDFNEDKHKILNSELKHLYTAITRARVNVWIYDEDTEARKPVFEYFKALDLVESIDAKRGGLTEDVFVKKSTPSEWRRRAKEFYLANQFKPAAKCYQRARDASGQEGLPNDRDAIMQEVCLAHERAVSAQSRPPSDPERRDEFLSAALQYLRCEMPELYLKAALCLRNAKEYLLAAKLYRHIGRSLEAARLFRRELHLNEAVRCFEDVDYYDEAVQILYEMKHYQEAILVCKMYQQKLEESVHTPDQLRLLETHKPRYEQQDLVFKVAENKLEKVDKMASIDDKVKEIIEDVWHILSTDLKWNEQRITEWFVKEKGRRRLAAVLLEEKGHLMEAAVQYRDMDDYRSAISCLDKCKDQTSAKHQLADCLMTVCRRYFHLYGTGRTTVEDSDKSPQALEHRGQYRRDMDLALEYMDELDSFNKLGECLLIEGLVYNRSDYFKEAKSQFASGQLEIGEIHALYHLSAKESLNCGSQFYALRGLSRIFDCLQRRTTTEYRKILKFYGFVDGHSQPYSMIENLHERDDELDEKKAASLIKEDLLKKARRLLKISVRSFREELKAKTQCPFYDVKDCSDGCPYLHQQMNAENLRQAVIASRRYILAHGFLLHNSNKDDDIKKMYKTLEREKKLDPQCWLSLIRLLMLNKPDYFTDSKTVLDVFNLLWRREDSDALTVLKWDANLKNSDELKELAVDSNRLILCLYNAMASGEYLKTNNMKTISDLTERLKTVTKGKMECDYKSRSTFCNVFLFLALGFYHHYSTNNPVEAQFNVNRYLEVISIKTNKEARMCPQAETIMPVFEFQFVRGMLLYTKANNMTPAFLPRSYLRVMTLFDTLCSQESRSSVWIVDQYRKDYSHTTVRNQLRVLCEVFLGVRSRKFNMLKSAVRSKDGSVVQRVVVFALVMLVNVGLIVDDKITFTKFLSGGGKRRLTVSLEEVIMKRLERLMIDADFASERLKALFQLIRSSKGLRDVAERLTDFVNSSNDELIETEWNAQSQQRLKQFPARSHLEMENKWLDYNPNQPSDNYKWLLELDVEYASEAVFGSTEEQTVPVMASAADPSHDDAANAPDDANVDAYGCEVCGLKFTLVEDDSYEARDARRREHIDSMEHRNTSKLHTKYHETMGPIMERMQYRMAEIESQHDVIKEYRPIDAFHELRTKYANYEARKAGYEKDSNWKMVGVLTLEAGAWNELADSVVKMITESETYQMQYKTTLPSNDQAQDAQQNNDDDFVEVVSSRSRGRRRQKMKRSYKIRRT